MLELPKDGEIVRDEEAEEQIRSKFLRWLEHENKDRDPRIHASDLLDPRKAYWNRQHKEPMTPQMIGNFMVGKVLHAFFSTAMNDKAGLSLQETDAGGQWSEELGITYSNDYALGKIPYEYKTSRAMKEQSISDLYAYREQLSIYQAAKNSLVGRLVVLRLNGEDRIKGYGTYPQPRCYEQTLTKKGLAFFKKQIKATVALLTKALKTKKKKDIQMLPVCRRWKCGPKNCGHWDLCRPEGRFGLPDNKWKS